MTIEITHAKPGCIIFKEDDTYYLYDNQVRSILNIIDKKGYTLKWCDAEFKVNNDCYKSIIITYGYQDSYSKSKFIDVLKIDSVYAFELLLGE